MEEEFRGGRPQLFDFITNGRDWSDKGGYGAAEEKNLELRLGLPGGEDWSAVQEKREHPAESAVSPGHIAKIPKSTNMSASSGAKRGCSDAVDSKPEGTLADKTTFQQQHLQQQQLGFLQLQAKGKESLHRTSGSAGLQSLEGKVCGPHAAHASSTKNTTATHSTSQSRAAAAPVVGWPPIRSFRKNLAGTAKASAESPNRRSEAEKKLENDRKGLFVKINMDGIPIGRKVDLKAYDSYEKLSLAVDELFRGLLMAAQMDLLAATTHSTIETHLISGLLDRSGEYTLVYEDDEGDKMLVGDVPWDMFVSTAKRLRVLKSSDLCASPLTGRNQEEDKRLLNWE
uniref:Auxin-responsive protein n=1 Tax=Musa acuminata subsp. malaccensis TaxID=214687 RepID=A0A804JVG5_MUSAM|nr:PREDICTED: auxin-responsive protein IAA2 isoform X1 [Musa acuminata subsp. malaccensis]